MLALRTCLLWYASSGFRGFLALVVVGDFCLLPGVFCGIFNAEHIGKASVGVDGAARVDPIAESNDLKASRSLSFGGCICGMLGTIVVATLDSVVGRDSFALATSLAALSARPSQKHMVLVVPQT